MDPRARLGLLLCVGVLAVVLEHPLALGLLAGASVLALVGARVEGRWWARGAVAVLAVVWSTALSQGLFYAEHPRVALVHLGPLTVWREGALYGLAQSLRFVAVTLAGLAVAVSTPSDRLHAALLALRVPFGLALMASTALGFVPTLASEVVAVRAARAHRGRPVWRRAPWAWLALEVRLLRPVVARAWRRAQVLAESLDARGFDPTAPRAVRRPLRLRWSDGAVLSAAVTVTGALATARVLYLLYTSEVLYLPALRGVYGAVRGWL